MVAVYTFHTQGKLFEVRGWGRGSCFFVENRAPTKRTQPPTVVCIKWKLSWNMYTLHVWCRFACSVGAYYKNFCSGAQSEVPLRVRCWLGVVVYVRAGGELYALENMCWIGCDIFAIGESMRFYTRSRRGGQFFAIRQPPQLPTKKKYRPSKTVVAVA